MQSYDEMSKKMTYSSRARHSVKSKKYYLLERGYHYFSPEVVFLFFRAPLYSVSRSGIIHVHWLASIYYSNMSKIARCVAPSHEVTFRYTIGIDIDPKYVFKQIVLRHKRTLPFTLQRYEKSLKPPNNYGKNSPVSACFLAVFFVAVARRESESRDPTR